MKTKRVDLKKEKQVLFKLYDDKDKFLMAITIPKDKEHDEKYLKSIIDWVIKLGVYEDVKAYFEKEYHTKCKCFTSKMDIETLDEIERKGNE